MNCDEFILQMKSHGAMLAPGANARAIAIANSTLQNMRVATLPKFMIDFYTQCSAMNLGSGYIFGPTQVKRGTKYPMPSLVEINAGLTGFPKLRGKTVFGRNDLFWFAFDAFGNCFMLDNTNLNCLRQYDDAYRAMTDCLVAGKL